MKAVVFISLQFIEHDDEILMDYRLDPKSNTLPGVEVTPLLGILPAVVRRDEAEDEQVAPLEDGSRGV